MNPTLTDADLKNDMHIHTKPPDSPRILDAVSLRQLCLDSGADDVGFVEIERPALAAERPHIERAFLPTRSLISIVMRMNRENIRNPARSLANKEFHLTGDETERVARKIVAELERAGVRALYPPVGFPMEAHKTLRPVPGSLRPASLRAFLDGMTVTFQREASAELNARYHFTFTGSEPAEVTMDIRHKTISVRAGLRDEPDLRVSADGEAWLCLLRRETSILKELLLRRVRVKGPITLLRSFGRCFPN